jgi:hypothetical protein
VELGISHSGENRLGMSDNGVLRKILGTEREEVTDCRRLHA